MAAYYQLWNDETHNLIDEFDSEASVFDEVRWRYRVWGEDVVEHLSLLRLEAGRKPIAVALGGELLRRAGGGRLPNEGGIALSGCHPAVPGVDRLIALLARSPSTTSKRSNRTFSGS